MSSKVAFRTPPWQAFQGILIWSWDSCLSEVEESKPGRAEVPLHIEGRAGSPWQLARPTMSYSETWFRIPAAFERGDQWAVAQEPSSRCHLVATLRCHLGVSGPSGEKWLPVTSLTYATRYKRYKVEKPSSHRTHFPKGEEQ